MAALPIMDVDISVATTANNIEAVPALVDSIWKLSRSSYNLQKESDETRQKLLSQARCLVQCLETPRETMGRDCWAQVWLLISQTYPTPEGTMMADPRLARHLLRRHFRR